MESPPRSPPDVFLALPREPERAAAVRGVRSTLVTSGLVILRDRGLFDRYLASIPLAHRPTVRGLIAGEWLPTEFMLAHYAAWDSLGLTADEIRVIGSAVSSRVSDNLLLAIKHITTGIGATPWTVLAQYPRLWSRAFDGGGVRIERSGPKEATIWLLEMPFARSAYFRGSLMAIHESALGLFATKLYARILPRSVADTTFAIRLAWV